MSGRSGYRKTDRKQGPRRPYIERLHELNDKATRKHPEQAWTPDVRIGFMLPRSIEAFVADGPHPGGVNITKGFVQICGDSTERCFARAREFLSHVARERSAFTLTVSIKSSSHPGHHFGRHLTVVQGNVVVSAGMIEPRVYEVRAA